MRTDTDTLFVKGLPLSHPRVWTQQREADVAPYVRGVAPELRWHVEADGWTLLAFQYVEGEYADFTPGFSDLPAVSAAMAYVHTAKQAEAVAAVHPAWKLAPPAGLDVFASIQERLWDSSAEQHPDEWAQPMQAAARVWNMHRQHRR